MQEGRHRRRAYVLAGEATATNRSLARAFVARGIETRIGQVDAARAFLESGDLAIGRFDVLRTLDGVEAGMWHAPRLQRVGVRLLNTPLALLAAHDKLSSALLLGRVGIPQPRTAHLRDADSSCSFAPPYVVKPRFGSWGHEVLLCEDAEALGACLHRLRNRRWFRRQGALLQELVPTGGRDLRLLVACGRVVGAVERRARPGEWRTNVALGGSRHAVAPSSEARMLALRAAAAIGVDLAGVDILRGSDGHHRVLEVNGAVDFTSDYALDGCDPFEAAADALLTDAHDPIRVQAAVTAPAFVHRTSPSTAIGSQVWRD